MMLKLAEIFQDHMILQRTMPIRLRGTSDCQQQVAVWLNDRLIFKDQIPKGTFTLELAGQEAMEDAVLTLEGGSGERLTFSHVDIGEVWIAGGQSNMEFLLQYDREGEAAAKLPADTHLRYYEVGKYAFEGEREEGLKDGSRWDCWKAFSPENAPWYSAVGVYFALQLRERLKVPVGIIGCNWGGTTAAAWMDRELLARDDVLRVYTDEYENTTKNLDMEKYLAKNLMIRRRSANPAVAANQAKVMKNENTRKPGWRDRLLAKLYSRGLMCGPHDENRPGGLYETMLKKIAGFGCAGVVWYQGEADEGHADIYSRLFSQLIECWRKDWNQRLPFLFVQLAPFEAWMGCTGKNFPQVRQQQQWVEDHVTDAYMASIMDVGSRYDIHPKEKRPVGQRLAALALNKIYGEPVGCEAPRLGSIRKIEGQLIVSFINAGNGLKLGEGNGLEELFCVLKGGRKLDCRVTVDGEQIRLISDAVTPGGEYSVSFGYMPYMKMPLYNRDGLPAKPFGPVNL